MRLRQKAVIVALLIGALWMGAAFGQKRQVKPEATSAYSDEDVRAMKADVQRMRALIMQMQNNLASVTSTTTPLKHQFELEIEMWQVAVRDLERRVNQAEERRHP